MLTVVEAIRWRRSIRRYRPDPVPAESIRLVLEAARLAPSGGNTQPWRFIVVTDPEERRRLREYGYGQRWLEEAPVVIVCCADLSVYGGEVRKSRREELFLAGILEDLEGSTIVQRSDAAMAERREPASYVAGAVANTYIAIENMSLTAASLGLGTCWMGGFEGPKLRQMFDLPDNIITVSLLSLGYPAQSPKQRPRLKLEDILLRPLPELATVSDEGIGYRV